MKKAVTPLMLSTLVDLKGIMISFMMILAVMTYAKVDSHFTPINETIKIGSIETDENEEPSTIFVYCPNNVYLNCNSYSGNPSDYGQPTVSNPYANVTITEHPPQFYMNNCGSGHIVRTWTIYSSYGSFYCSQTIYISGGGSFGYYNINWPLNYNAINVCTIDGLHPNNLPYPYNKPTWTAPPCSMIGVSFKDEVFYFDQPYNFNSTAGCKKILRTWKVIDWCTYQTNSNSSVGLWTYVQVIKVEDTIKPRFTYCPPDVTIGTFDNYCNGAYVNLPTPIATDNCNTNVKITHNSPYSYNYSNASGFYPLGTSYVRFIADDGCKNYDTCFVKVTVRDLKKPTAICYHGLTASLMQMGDDGFVQVPGKLFDAGSFDNCTPKHLLQFHLVPNTFTCADRGQNEVRMYVTDQSGNSDVCVTYIRIQDNMGMCPPDTTGGIISGLVQFVNGNLIEGVEVYSKMTQDEPESTTDEHGIYMMDKLVEGYDYEVMPSKKTSLIEGISTADLILLRRHILGQEKLENPYQIIAADINKDGVVNIQDYLQLRMMLLLNLHEFPGLYSWRFVDLAYEFENPLEPLNEDFTEVYFIEDHTKTDMNINFVGVKIGDLDGSCMPMDEEDDEEDGEGIDIITSRKYNMLDIELNDVALQKGHPISLELNAASALQMHGIQLTFAFDSDILQFEGIQEGGLLQGINDRNLGLHRLDEGLITLSWEQLGGINVEKGKSITTLNFFVKNAARLSEVFTIVSDPLKAEAYDSSLKTYDIRLNYINDGIAYTGIELLQSAPNPFSTECNIQFYLPENREIEFMVHDVTGKLVKQIQGEYANGMNQITLTRTDIPFAGLYTYTLISDGYISTRKLIVK